jgi:hypothetical protein
MKLIWQFEPGGFPETSLSQSTFTGVTIRNPVMIATGLGLTKWYWDAYLIKSPIDNITRPINEELLK